MRTTAALYELLGLGYAFHAHSADNICEIRTKDILTFSQAPLDQCVVTISTNAPQVAVVQEGERHYDLFPPVDLTPRGVQHDTGGTGK